MAVCTNHPARETGLGCSACERPFCFQCLEQLAVGQKCRDCARGLQIGPSGERPGRIAVARNAAKRDRHMITKAAVATMAAANVYFIARSSENLGLLLGVERFGIATGPIQAGETWRLLTGAIGLSNPFSLIANLVLFWWLGRFVESKVGHARFLGLIVAGLGVAVLGVLLVYPNSVTFAGFGASGVMVGAYFAGVRVGELPALRMRLGSGVTGCCRCSSSARHSSGFFSKRATWSLSLPPPSPERW